MSKSTLDALDVSEQIAKRAQWEAFEFTVLPNGDLEVVNGSHDDPDEHTYTVHVEQGIPSDCTCPAWEYQEGACKHMVAVAIRDPVLTAAERTVRTDGGVTTANETNDDERPDDCDCAPFMGDLPCWPCYRDGFDNPNPNPGEEDE